MLLAKVNLLKEIEKFKELLKEDDKEVKRVLRYYEKIIFLLKLSSKIYKGVLNDEKKIYGRAFN